MVSPECGTRLPSTPKTIQYLRVSLTNKCNLGCFYCKPREGDRPAVNRTPIQFYYRAIGLLHKSGVRKIRFTGGEPTLYNGLLELVSFTKSRSSGMHVAVTTNGLMLNRLARPLAEAGLDSVNVSLDTLDRDRFAQIAGTDKLTRVLSGIETALTYLPEVKLNCVVMRGVNDREVKEMILAADAWKISIRFIEFMPARHSADMRTLFVSGKTLRESLPFDLKPLEGEASSAARYYGADQLCIRVGFIEPVSNPFCRNCNRARLSSDGRLFNCLFSSHSIDLKAALARGEEFALQEVLRLTSHSEQGCMTRRSTDDLPSFVSIGG